MQKRSEGDLCRPVRPLLPGRVYEWINEGDAGPRYVINARTASTARTLRPHGPQRKITAVALKGAAGPNYQNM